MRTNINVENIYMPACEEFDVVELFASEYIPSRTLKNFFKKDTRLATKVTVSRIMRDYNSVEGTHTKLITDKLLKAEVIVHDCIESEKTYEAMNKLILDDNYFKSIAKVVKLNE